MQLSAFASLLGRFISELQRRKAKIACRFKYDPHATVYTRMW